MMSKVILITGCSSGIGREMAERLSKNGYTVVATARNLNDMENLNVALKLSLDITNNESILDAVNKVMQHFGKIDVLINNAGYAFRSAVEEISDNNIEQMFNVNVYGIIRMIRVVVPYMRKERSGRIINISSIAGKMVLPVSGAYCASKFATEALSDALRLELSAFGISVVVVEPGNIRTNFMKTVQNNSDRIISDSNSPYDELYKNYKTFNDNARTNEPGPEVVSLVVQKAIEASRPQKRYMAGVPSFNRMMTHFGDGVKDCVVKSLFKIK
ncbi:SDR family oxidoreductase [Clostridium sp. YIM B02555]|uniref:SDR family oxidoreductase n=1 Tax=Clostridium sp. YIM B02555 TaxID=2911968 RepID=UPI001EEF00B1|nr:SDR family oxidoreductase [Clostridium sp. YIM B02555]